MDPMGEAFAEYRAECARIAAFVDAIDPALQAIVETIRGRFPVTDDRYGSPDVAVVREVCARLLSKVEADGLSGCALCCG